MDIFMVEYLENCLTNMAVKEFWKSVYICQSYDKKSSVLFFFETQCSGLDTLQSVLTV